VGTHNYEIGVNLAKLAMVIKPKGGTICIQSGGAAANHNERMQGIRDTLSGKLSKHSPGERLTGQSGWKEIGVRAVPAAGVSQGGGEGEGAHR
jgi:ribose transport system substrate-binding protein